MIFSFKTEEKTPSNKMPKKKKDVANKDKARKSFNRKLLLSSDVEGTIYGKVTKVLGNCLFIVFGYDGIERMCAVRGDRKDKRNRVELNSTVLVGLRDFQKERGDIVYVYTDDESVELMNMGEIPRDDNDDDIIFTEREEEVANNLPVVIDFDSL